MDFKVKAKVVAKRSVLLLVAILILLIQPVVAILALPWAWLTSLGDWGYTPFEEWKDDWEVWSLSSFKDLWRHLTKPLREGA